MIGVLAALAFLLIKWDQSPIWLEAIGLALLVAIQVWLGFRGIAKIGRLTSGR